MSSEEIIDGSEVAEKSSAIDLFFRGVRKSLKFNSIGKNKTVYSMVVLTEPTKIDDAVASVFSNSKASKVAAYLFKSLSQRSAGKFVFYARIDEKNSPHSFIPDPCSIEFADNPEAAAKIIALHTIVVSSEEHAIQGAIKVGDTVQIRLRNGNLQHGELIGLDSAGASQVAQSCQKISELISPQDKFTFSALVQSAISTLGSYNDSSQPRAEYPPCSAGVRQWTKISQHEFAQKVKSVISNKSLALSVIALAITEQPSGSSLGGYNYNHYGVMTDLKGGWGSGIKCSVPSTEGAGGSGDRREKIRWFAAFENEEAGIKFAASKLQGRTGTDENGKKLAFASVTNGIDWAKLHTLKWLSPGDKEERIKNTSKMASKGANFDTAVQLYG
tara:strand:- start:1720 stop:2880 length:1161 start_codon:yes stop_codon:yes gene_type:complete